MVFSISEYQSVPSISSLFFDSKLSPPPAFQADPASGVYFNYHHFVLHSFDFDFQELFLTNQFLGVLQISLFALFAVSKAGAG